MKKNILIFCLLLCLSKSYGQKVLVGSIYYVLSDAATAMVTSPAYDSPGYFGDIVIPNVVSVGDVDYIVTSIGEEAFYGCSNLTSITLSENIMSIELRAFWYCTGLISVTIKGSLANFGRYPFRYCSALTSIHLSKNVSNFDNITFYECEAITSINVESGNATYASIDGVLFNKDKTMLIFCPLGKTGNYVVPNGVTTIEEMAFGHCKKLNSVTLSNDVIGIKMHAFYDCSNLTSVTLSKSLEYIGVRAFIGCESLAAINIPNNVTGIGNSAFYGCNALASITFSSPSSVEYIDNRVFEYCSITEFTIPNSVKRISSDTFYNCNTLTSVKVEAGSTTYSSEDGVLFDKDKTTLIYFPAGKAGQYIIPASVTTIGTSAFYNCKGLTSVAIPRYVTSIGGFCFSGCTNLKSIINLNPVPVNAGREYVAGVRLYVPINTKTAYQSSTYWRYCNVIELPKALKDDITVKFSDKKALIGGELYEGASGYRFIVYGNEAHTDTINVAKFDSIGNNFNTTSFRSASLSSEDNKFSYTIENLLSDTEYYYTFEILGIDDVVLDIISDKFTTESDPSNINVPQAEITEAVIAGYYSILGAKLQHKPTKGMYIILYSDGKVEKIMR